MSARKNLRALFAEVLLTAAPIVLACRGDGVSVRIEFATHAELRAWLTDAGLPEPSDHDVCEWTDSAGRVRRSLTTYPTWRGWKVYAEADEPAAPAPVPLPARTVDRLSVVAEVVA
jgi:hypothetical protein